MPPHGHPFVGLQQGWLQLGGKRAVQAVIQCPGNRTVPTLPRKGDVGIGMGTFVIKPVEWPVHFADMPLRHSNHQLPVELDMDGVAPDRPGTYPRVNLKNLT
jgi:hypothetical protein